jgi:hypothetical protein
MSDEQIPISIFNWGPCVVKLKIKDEFKKLLLSESKKNKLDYKDKLAGIIESETGYSDESKQLLLPDLSAYLGVYDQAYQRYVNKLHDKKPEYVLSAMWINHQKANEYNPPHDHDGKISFVIYCSIPEELKEEHKAYVGKSCGPGGIQFVYGDGPRECVTHASFMPEEGDMYIFPAWLKHWVAPFKSDCVRISVSGNFHDSAPLNNIHQFGPKYRGKK